MTSGAVRLPYPEPVDLVAIGFGDQGPSDHMGVWAVTDLHHPGAEIWAVDEIAQRFTDWPDADTSPFRISTTEAEAAQAKWCLDGDPAHLSGVTGSVVR